MVNQCANPDCQRELHYLREGKIYLFALSTPSGTKRLEHFWLCGRCSRTMVLMCRNQSDVQITLRPQEHQGGIEGPRTEASVASFASIYQSLPAQAACLAYVDTFMVLCVVSAITIVLSFFLKKNEPGAGGAVAA